MQLEYQIIKNPNELKTTNPNHVQGVAQQHIIHLNDPPIAQHREDNVSNATNSIVLPKYVGNPKKTASALIAHVKYDNHIDQHTAATTDVTTEILAIVSIHTPGSNNNTTTL